MKRAWIAALAATCMLSCVPSGDEDLGVLESELSHAVRRDRSALIRDTAAAQGITNGLMIAMIAEEETYLSHCASEFPACPGPASSDCGGRAVMSGGGDGACSLNRGGLGMFQIDDGTESDTVRVHGAGVLTMTGNTQVAIDRVINKLIVSHYVGISTRADAISFLNNLRIDDANWDHWIRTLVRYWNGCREGASCWRDRYTKYDRAARTLLSEMGRPFWYPDTMPPPSGSGWISSPIASPRITSPVSHARGRGWVNHACTSLSRANHRGTDFGVSIGTPVYAAAEGTVIRSVTGCPNTGSLSSTCGGGFGNHVILLHDGGNATLYAHLSPDGTQIRNGAHVACGQLLGHSGHSGRSSAPHLHFEVRAGVTDAASYFSRGRTLDPYGGACSSQSENLWVGGAPMMACSDTRERDDAAVIHAQYPSTVNAPSGTRLTQVWTIRNRGTTTWTPMDYVLQHQSGAFGEAREVALPDGARVAPGQKIELRVTVTVPSAAGQHKGVWRMVHRGVGAFGGDAKLTVQVRAAPRSCNSATLHRTVPSGSCVQVDYAGCGTSSCAWFRCSDGAWLCTQESECSAETSYASAACAPPEAPPDGGMCMGSPRGGACTTPDDCCEGLTCEQDDTGDKACCHGRGSACGSTAECCGTMQCASGFCGCVPENQLCWNDSDCCDGLGCIAGACRPTNGCARETQGCSTRDDCCTGLSCQMSAGGGNQCCISAGNRCEGDGDCCGQMQCTDGHCACRAQGESCSNLLDCCGALLCENGVCTF